MAFGLLTHRFPPAALAAALVVAFASSAPASTTEPVLISRASGPAGTKGNADSAFPSISADGKLVAFHSRATNLVPEDTDSHWDVFVRDLASDTTMLVSRASGATGAKGNGDSVLPSISPDGRFVAFDSDAGNLVAEVDDGNTHVYMRDLLTGNVVVVDRASGVDGAISDRGAGGPSISAGGTHVAFVSYSTNLDSAPVGNLDVFVRDLTTNTTQMVSRASGPSGASGPNESSRPSISKDGTRIAFHSFDKTVAPNGAINPLYGAVFVRDLETQKTILASRETGRNGRVAGHGAQSPAISGNGRRVAFTTGGENLHPRDRTRADDVYVRDLETNRTIYASRDLRKFRGERPSSASRPSLSANGRHVAFSEHFDSPSTSFHFRAAVRDLKRRTNQLLPDAVTERVPEDSLAPMISGNSRWLAFQSRAGTASDDDGDQILDVFAERIPQRR